MARGYARPILIYVAAFAVLVWVAFPLLWLLKSSFSPESEILSIPPDLIPRHPIPDYYLGLFHDVPGINPGTGQQLLIPRALLTSVVIATCVMAVNIAVGAPAAYAIARYRFPLSHW